MKQSKLVWLSLFCCLTALELFAQGQFAGVKSRELIGKKYNQGPSLPGLAGFEYRESGLAFGINEPEQFSVTVFQNGPTYIVFFAINEDTAANNYTILDVLLIKRVKSSQVIKTLVCRQDKISNEAIVAVTQPGSSEYSRALKAWRFNRDKRRFELISIKEIDCLNEGDD
ncbi:MAG: hypothetical protein J0L56_12135 [Chitinophagales bacterium]|nr:hypothetical protein [Chitinophagales bacterium]